MPNSQKPTFHINTVYFYKHLKPAPQPMGLGEGFHRTTLILLASSSKTNIFYLEPKLVIVYILLIIIVRAVGII